MRHAPFDSFEEYWPHFVGLHRHPLNRALHAGGLVIALASVAAGAATMNPALVVGGPLVAYACARAGHALIERNWPAALGRPLWAIRADLRMLHLTLRGQMSAEVVRLYGSEHPAPDAPLAA